MLKGSYNGLTTTFQLTNCLHIPDAHVNLISQVRLDQFGILAILGNGKVVLQKDGIKFVDGNIHNELYQLHVLPIKTGENAENTSLVMMANDPNEAPGFYIA